MWPRRTSSRNFRGSVGGRCRRRFLRGQRRSMLRRPYLITSLNRDAGCEMRDASRPVATEFADETDGHGDHAVAQVDDCANVSGRHELESREYGEVTVQFGVGSQSDLESAEELRRGPQRIALRNVCRYREGCPTDLVNKREMPAKLRAQCQQVRLVGELLSTAPSVETLELPHVREHVVGGRQRRYPIPACWCGFHASRIPHLASRV